ncbi:MAG: hypothetical protein H6983_20295 [Ectothiorhodospiraceae bacterium]|nr:hypothetical protein [Chromatiales bacterium]MCP5156527.1 hypothetical protein [Ectothiorhodospiraceae bacterium]
MRNDEPKPSESQITENGAVELDETELEQVAGGVKYGDITLKVTDTSSQKVTPDGTLSWKVTRG